MLEFLEALFQSDVILEAAIDVVDSLTTPFHCNRCGFTVACSQEATKTEAQSIKTGPTPKDPDDHVLRRAQSSCYEVVAESERVNLTGRGAKQ